MLNVTVPPGTIGVAVVEFNVLVNAKSNVCSTGTVAGSESSSSPPLLSTVSSFPCGSSFTSSGLLSSSGVLIPLSSVSVAKLISATFSRLVPLKSSSITNVIDTVSLPSLTKTSAIGVINSAVPSLLLSCQAASDKVKPSGI